MGGCHEIFSANPTARRASEYRRANLVFVAITFNIELHLLLHLKPCETQPCTICSKVDYLSFRLHRRRTPAVEHPEIRDDSSASFPSSAFAHPTVHRRVPRPNPTHTDLDSRTPKFGKEKRKHNERPNDMVFDRNRQGHPV